MQKVHRYIFLIYRLIVCILFQIFSLPIQEGSFHLSFTVLVHYRSHMHMSGLEGGSPIFKQFERSTLQ